MRLSSAGAVVRGRVVRDRPALPARAWVAAAAGPLSSVVLSHRDPTTFRIAVLGLWAFTNLELAYALLRVDERLRTYATASLTNVGCILRCIVTRVAGLSSSTPMRARSSASSVPVLSATR